MAGHRLVAVNGDSVVGWAARFADKTLCVFPENAASLALQLQTGFRIVGRRERIAQLSGIWRDTLLLERRS